MQIKSLDKEFRLTVNGEENEEATEIFEAGWFMEYMRLMLDAKLFGFTLVEFGAIEDNKFVKWRTDDGLIRDAVQLIDRDHVKPELGIVTEQQLRSNRQFVVIGVFILAALLTPPDAVSQVLMAIPLLILYELSIIVAKIFGKKEDSD